MHDALPSLELELVAKELPHVLRQHPSRRSHRRVGEEVLEGHLELARDLESTTRLVSQRLEYDALEALRIVGADAARRGNDAVLDRGDRLRLGITAEEPSAKGDLVEVDADREDVRPGVNLEATALLMYPYLPLIWPVLVTEILLAALAIPKSTILTPPSYVTSTFVGEMSR